MSGGNQEVKRSLTIALFLTFTFMTVEAVGGWMAGSLAMLGDAAHMMTDAASFGVSLAAVYLSEHGATAKMTFGHGRVEVLAALWSTLSIWLLTGLLVGESIRRIKLFFEGRAEPVNGAMMTLLGTLGVVMNVVLERVLGGHHDGEHGGHHSHSHGHSHGLASREKEAQQELVRVEEGDHHHDDHDHQHHDHDHGHGAGHDDAKANGNEATKLGKKPSYSAVSTTDHDDHHHDEHRHHHDDDSSDDDDHHSSSHVGNMNIDAAYLHVLGDLLQSLGVVVAGIIIWINPKMVIADPICTLLFAVIVLVTTCSMLQHSIVLLLQGAPDHISVDDLQAELAAIEGVCDVHDLHVWELTPGRPLLSVHVGVIPDSHRTVEEVLTEAHSVSKDAGIEFATIQVQKTIDGSCASHACFNKSLASA